MHVQVSEGLVARAKENSRDPVAWTEVIQIVKTVIAAVLAWVVAVDGLGLSQAFLAPWSALLVVHGTVYRTFSDGIQQVGATVLGVVLAWLVGNALGLDPVGLAVLVLAGLAIGKLSRLHVDGTAIAATAVVVLTVGYTDNGPMLLVRFVDTGIGIGVGLLVNLVVWPPLRDRTAARAIDAIDDRIGELLRDMADALGGTCDEDAVQGWLDRTRDLDHSIDDAWSLLRQAQESGRLNPRRAAGDVRRPGEFGDVLERNEQAVAEARSMARTLGHSVTEVNSWDEQFHDRWIGLLAEAGRAIGVSDADGVTGVGAKLATLAVDLSTEDLSGRHWPEYGALMMNLRNIVASMDRVAKVNPVITPRSRQHRFFVRG